MNDEGARETAPLFFAQDKESARADSFRAKIPEGVRFAAAALGFTSATEGRSN
jgi:hypothetical protein